MTEDEFWGHIRATRRKDPEAHAGRLDARLAELPPDEILDFQAIWDDARDRAYRWDVWAAAYLINAGCSDDGFIDFRCWLIVQGREVFAAAVADPDTLAAVVDPEADRYEAEVSPGIVAWFTATGTEDTRAGSDAYDAAFAARHPGRPPLPDLGPRWDFDDNAEYRRRLPRLSALYLTDEDV